MFLSFLMTRQFDTKNQEINQENKNQLQTQYRNKLKKHRNQLPSKYINLEKRYKKSKNDNKILIKKIYKLKNTKKHEIINAQNLLIKNNTLNMQQSPSNHNDAAAILVKSARNIKDNIKKMNKYLSEIKNIPTDLKYLYSNNTLNPENQKAIKIK
jgi:hypothetical protein